jgi:hypothetical protein
MVDLPDKVQVYIDKVERETGRSVFVQVNSRLDTARFRLEEANIRVEIPQRCLGFPEMLEFSVVHEATHGLLICGRGYCYFDWSHQGGDVKERAIAEILLTVITDIPVNRVIQQDGFDPVNPGYFDDLEQETKTARKGKAPNYFRKFSPSLLEDPVFRNRLMALWYIMVWGSLEYYELDQRQRKIIHKAIKAFRALHPESFKTANQLADIISQNNLFTPEGCCNVIERCLELWGLNDLA